MPENQSGAERLRNLETQFERLNAFLRSELGRDSDSQGNVHYHIQRIENSCEKSTNEIKHLLQGNGQPGLITRMARVETHQKATQSSNGNWIAIGAVVIAGVGTLLNVLFAVMK